MKDSCLKDYCEGLRIRYMEYITLEQLRIILRIAKRTATHLVTDAIIPAIDTGKQTWRYRIAIEDVVDYILSNDTEAQESKSGNDLATRVTSRILRRAYGEMISRLAQVDIVERFEKAYADYPDVLTVYEASEILGLSRDTILRHIKSGAMKAFKIAGKYMIPQGYTIMFLKTQEFINSPSSAEFMPRLLNGLEIKTGERMSKCGEVDYATL